MFCFHCGEKIPDGSKACNLCGISFVAGGKTAIVPPPPQVITGKSGTDEAQPEPSPASPQPSPASPPQIPTAPPGPGNDAKNLCSTGDALSLPATQHQIQFPAGTILAGRFRLDKAIGQGGCGEVFLAFDTAENQRIALKIIAFDSVSGPVAFEEVRRELVDRDKVNDFAYVLKTHGFFTVPGYQGHFLLLNAMELAPLGNLRRWLLDNRKNLDFRRQTGLDFFVQAVAGAKALHAKGIVHLDLKPENMLFCGDSKGCTMKISDFAISPMAEQRILDQASPLLTGWETFVYKSPEQFLAPRQEEIQPASDIYSLGIVLFEILDPYGRPPFDGSPLDLRRKHIEVAPPKIRGLDERLEQILKKCLAKKTEDRYPNSDALYAALQSYFGGIIGKKNIPFQLPMVSSYSSFSREGPAKAPGDLEKVLTNSIGMKLRLIPVGSANIGSNRDGNQNGPVHNVALTKPFYLGIIPVTQEFYEKVMGVNPSHFKWPGRPVENVNWDEAKEFCRRLSEIDKRKYRLPTEAEWEYACRAGTSTEYYWGDTYNGDFCWCRSNSEQESHEAGTRLANAWELYEMCGNVWEWCEDWHGPYPDKDVVDPKGPPSGTTKVLRGGSWCDQPEDCRCTTRGRSDPALRINVFGFRVAARAG